MHSNLIFILSSIVSYRTSPSPELWQGAVMLMGTSAGELGVFALWLRGSLEHPLKTIIFSPICTFFFFFFLDICRRAGLVAAPSPPTPSAWATKSKNNNAHKTDPFVPPYCRSRLGLPRVSRRPGRQHSYRPSGVDQKVVTPFPSTISAFLTRLALVTYAPLWSSPFPYPLSSAFRSSSVETR